jgi:hypothetical protein
MWKQKEDSDSSQKKNGAILEGGKEVRKAKRKQKEKKPIKTEVKFKEYTII